MREKKLNKIESQLSTEYDESEASQSRKNFQTQKSVQSVQSGQSIQLPYKKNNKKEDEIRRFSFLGDQPLNDINDKLTNSLDVNKQDIKNEHKNSSFIKNPEVKSKTSKKYLKSFKQRQDSINVATVSFIGTQPLNDITDKLANKLDVSMQENKNENAHKKRDNLEKKDERVCCTSLTKGKLSKIDGGKRT